MEISTWKYSTSLGITGMQIKTRMKYHSTPIRMAKIKNAKENVEELGHSYIADEKC